MRVNEYVQVDTSRSGAPLRFTWRGVSYHVIAKPEPWLSRRPWWAEHTTAPSSRASNRPSAHSIDLRMWRIEAIPLAQVHHASESTCDLCYEVSLNAWTLVSIWSDDFDQQLFP